MTISAPIYDRAPSEALKKLLLPGGFLSPLVELTGKRVGRHYHDVHFRTNDEMDVYRGGTTLVHIKTNGACHVDLTAYRTYKNQPCGQSFLRRWNVDEPDFKDALDRYLTTVEVTPRWTRREGAIQEQWSQINVPWTPFDREGVLGGPHPVGKDFPQVQVVLDQLMELSQRNDWVTPEATGREIDQLAVDPEGRLVLLELKDASKGSNRSKNYADVYYAPFQLLQYVWEWHTALEAVRNDLQAIIDSRIAVGLTLSDVPRLTGGIRAAVGFGADERTDRVKRRYLATLDTVNNHLPADVAPVETWAFTDDGPRLVS